MCFSEYMMSKCNCQDMSTLTLYENYTLVPPCLNMNDLFCDLQQYTAFFSQNVKELCSQDCPLECSRIEYSTSTTSSSYPTHVYYEYLKNQTIVQSKFNNDVSQLTYEKLKSQIVAVNVYYDDLSYIKISENAQTELIDLVSNLGGTLGLFIGVSFLSFAEILDLIFNLCYILLKYQISRKVGNTNEIR